MKNGHWFLFFFQFYVFLTKGSLSLNKIRQIWCKKWVQCLLNWVKFSLLIAQKKSIFFFLLFLQFLQSLACNWVIIPTKYAYFKEEEKKEVTIASLEPEESNAAAAGPFCFSMLPAVTIGPEFLLCDWSAGDHKLGLPSSPPI